MIHKTSQTLMLMESMLALRAGGREASVESLGSFVSRIARDIRGPRVSQALRASRAFMATRALGTPKTSNVPQLTGMPWLLSLFGLQALQGFSVPRGLVFSSYQVSQSF